MLRRRRLRLPALPRSGRGPELRGGRRHRRRLVHPLLLGRAVRQRRHDPRADRRSAASAARRCTGSSGPRRSVPATRDAGRPDAGSRPHGPARPNRNAPGRPGASSVSAGLPAAYSLVAAFLALGAALAVAFGAAFGRRGLLRRPLGAAFVARRLGRRLRRGRLGLGGASRSPRRLRPSRRRPRRGRSCSARRGPCRPRSGRPSPCRPCRRRCGPWRPSPRRPCRSS